MARNARLPSNGHPVLEIDPEKEKLYLLRDIARMGLFPGETSYKTVYRYAVHGRQNYSGATVFLGIVNTPAGMASSREAVLRFIRLLNA